MAGVNTFNGIQETVDITSTPSEILPSNGSRRFLLIQNIGANNVYIKFGSDPVAITDGILLQANGRGVLFMDVIVESKSVNAVCSATESTRLFVLEGSS